MAEKTTNVDGLLTKIAVDNLLLDEAGTLETRKMDRLDFHDCAVWGIKKALQDAFALGAKMGNDDG